MVRHYSYVCIKSCSSVMHLFIGSCCFLCRQPKCKSRLGYITSSDVSGRWTDFKCEICGFVLMSQNCLDNSYETRLCSLFVKCSPCSGTKPRHSTATHRGSKRRCSVCSHYFKHASQEDSESFVHRPKSIVRSVSCEIDPGSSRKVSNQREE